MQSAFADVTVLEKKRIVLISSFLVFIKWSDERCRDELAAFPTQGAFYVQTLSSFDWVSRRLLPYSHDSVTLLNPTGQALDAGALSEHGACVAVHSTLQLFLGLLIPLTILATEQRLSQNDFEMRHNIGFPFKDRYLASLIKSLLLVPFEAAVGLFAITRGLHFLSAT